MSIGDWMMDLRAAYNDQQARIAALETENARLQSFLIAIRDSNPPLPSERNKSYYWMSRAKHYQEIAKNALDESEG